MVPDDGRADAKIWVKNGRVAQEQQSGIQLFDGTPVLLQQARGLMRHQVPRVGWLSCGQRATAAGCSWNAGTTCSMNSSRERFFSSWVRLLSDQTLNSVTPRDS